MENLLGLNLGEAKKSEIIYVTESLESDLELLDTELSKTIELGNIINYAKLLGAKDSSKFKKLLNKYKNTSVKDFKDDVNKLLSFIKGNCNIQSSEKEELKERFVKLIKNQAIIDIIVNKDKLYELFKKQYDPKIANEILTILDSIPEMDTVNILSKDVYESIIEEMIKKFDTFNINKEILDLIEELVNKASEYLKEINNKTKEEKEDIVKEEPVKNLFRPIFDINKLNEASKEIVSNLGEQVGVMSPINIKANVSEKVDKIANTLENKNKKEEEKEEVDYTCNHCKDPECKRKPGELSALCIHANDSINNKKGSK